jgi:hypothetical protein
VIDSITTNIMSQIWLIVALCCSIYLNGAVFEFFSLQETISNLRARKITRRWYHGLPFLRMDEDATAMMETPKKMP